MSHVVEKPTLPPEVEAAQLVFQAATGYIVSSALQCAMQLKLADRLATGPRTSAELASATGVDEHALYRVLRALAGVGIFSELAPRTFELNAPGQLCRSDVPGAYPLLLWLSDPFHFNVYAEMMHSVRSGQPASDKVVGMSVFEYFAQNRELSEIFNDAMTCFSAMVIPAALKAYDFSGIGTLVDIAGGHGGVLTAILKQYPAMRGILFDVDHVIAGATRRIAAMELSDRCTTASGDFFAAVPAGGDAYLMKHIIHDWDDERATAILENIRTALAGTPQGRLILLEAVIPPGNQPDLSKLIDLEMLALPGGRERTADEFGALLAGAGFELTRIVPTESPLSIVEARPR